MTFRKILVAIDDTALAIHAAKTGISLARALGAEIAPIHVVSIPVAHGRGAGIPESEAAALFQRESLELVRDLRARLQLGDSVEGFMELGDPAEEIVKAAAAWPADLVVIGSHSRSSLGRVLLGSVSEAVVRNSPCPVLLVRAHE